MGWQKVDVPAAEVIERQGPRGPLGPPSCTICGALMGDVALHERFHADHGDYDPAVAATEPQP